MKISSQTATPTAEIHPGLNGVATHRAEFGATTLAASLTVSPSGRRNLLALSLYRIACATALLGVALLFDLKSFNITAPYSFLVGASFYLLFAVVGLWWTGRSTLPLPIPLLLTAMLAGDIFFIALLTLASSGSGGPLPILLLPQLAASGWLLPLRIAFFHAASAALVLLGIDVWSLLGSPAGHAQPFQTGLIGFGYFAIVGIALALGSYAKASEALAEQRGQDLVHLEQINRLIIQDMKDGVLVVDEVGRLQSCNAQAARLLGVYGQWQSGQRLDELSGRLSADWTAWMEGRDGTTAPLVIEATRRSLRSRFVRIGSGLGGGTMIYLEDLGRAQQEAQQMKLAAMGRLTASIAHEVRNPLSAINHAAQLLDEDETIAGDGRRLLAMILSNTRRIDRIVGEVLQLTRRDRQERDRIPFDEFVRTLVDDIARGEQIPPGCITLDLAEKLVVLFDRGQLSQILWNLLRNSWQHCRRSAGSIRVTARAGYLGDAVLVEIIDDGPGIPIDLRTQVFEPFFTTRQGGTGLGLYIARELAEANAASLDLLPDGPGARFRLTLRRGDAPSALPGEPAAST